MVFSNKGQAVFDLVILLLIVFFIAVAALFGGYIFSQLNDEIQSDPDFDTLSKSTSNTLNTNYVTIFDNVIFFTIILLWIGLIATSFMIDTHPIFFIITIFFMIVVFIAGMALANAYEDISSDNDLSVYSQGFTKTNFIFDNFLLSLIVIGFSTALALYAKSGGGL